MCFCLQYLATGNSFHSLYYKYLIGITIIRTIVRDTCDKIWMCLKSAYIAEKNEDTWRAAADKFAIKTDFPNCLGAVDGKHIRIQKPNQSGSLFFNYKQHFSVILMAVVDADYCFISVDIGSYGSVSDSNVFQHSNFGLKLEMGQLHVPENR